MNVELCNTSGNAVSIIPVAVISVSLRSYHRRMHSVHNIV